jgi:nucleoredoxin
MVAQKASPNGGIAALLGDSLIGKSGTVDTTAALKGKTVGIYFSAHWCPPCRGFTPELTKSYKKLIANGKPFEVVFASSDRDEASFKEYYNEMPWLALPYEDRDRKNALSKKFKVSGIPTLVIVDENGETITTDGRSAIGEDAEGENFPWKPKSFAESLGDSFCAKDGAMVGLEALKGKTLGIYFSAHWCPPCKAFTPKLVKTYNKVKATRSDFEVVFVSSDRDQGAFDGYYAEMPWLAIPHGDRRKGDLSKLFDVEGIPTFVIIDADGKVINSDGRSAVSADPEGLEFPWKPKPVNDIENPTNLNDQPCLCLLMDGAQDAAEKQCVWQAAVHEVASEHIEACEANGVPQEMYFYTAKQQGDVVDQVRKLAEVGEPKPQPLMLILDIPDDGGFYVSDAKDVTADSIRTFVKAYKEKSIERRQLSR